MAKNATDTAPAPQTQSVALEDRPILIPQIAGFLNWLEELITTSAGLLLSAVLVITLTSLLTGGTLLKDSAFLGGAYAVAQGIGIEGQLTGMTVRSVRLWRNNQKGSAFVMFVIVLILFVVSFIGAAVVNHQETFGTSTLQALEGIGVSKWWWDVIRAGVLVLLVVISAAMRYTPALTLEQKEAKIKEDMRLKALRQESMGQSIMAFASLGKAALNTVTNKGIKDGESTSEDEGNEQGSMPQTTEKRERIEAHLVTDDWRDTTLLWWNKTALKAWLSDEYERVISGDKANALLAKASEDDQGRPARVASQGEPFVAMKDDIKRHAIKMLRLKKAPRNATGKVRGKGGAIITPLERRDEGDRAANG